MVGGRHLPPTEKQTQQSAENGPVHHGQEKKTPNGKKGNTQREDKARAQYMESWAIDMDVDTLEEKRSIPMSSQRVTVNQKNLEVSSLAFQEKEPNTTKKSLRRETGMISNG